MHFEDFYNEIVFCFFQFFLLQKAVTELSFFSSQYFHLYLRRPRVLLKLVGRCRFGGGGAVRGYLLWALSFVKPKIIEKKLGKEDSCPLLLGGKGSLGRVWRLPGAHQPFTNQPPVILHAELW